MHNPDTTTSGILLVDKPQGATSHDCVDFIRRKFNFSKVGHAGTLDPMATGLLIILIGKATKAQGDFLNDDKTYDGCLCLGVVTDTLDKEGNIIGKTECKADEKTIREAVKKFIGQIEQVPPMFSAKKHKGKKLYQYARKGIEIKREPKKVIIKSIEITKISGENVSFTVKCSKGTYVRQLAHDIGQAVGCGAHLTGLRRTESGKFSVKGALDFIKLKDLSKEKLNEYIIPVKQI